MEELINTVVTSSVENRGKKWMFSLEKLVHVTNREVMNQSNCFETIVATDESGK